MPKTFDQILKSALLKEGIITDKKIDAILKEAAISKTTLIYSLINKKIITKLDALNLVASEFGITAIDLKNATAQPQAISKIPTRIAFYYKFIPIEIEDRLLTLAVSSPFDVKTQDEIRTHLGYDIKMVLALEDEISEALKKYYGLGADTLQKISSTQTEITPKEKAVDNIEDFVEEASVIKLVNEIIFEAYKKRATDIHIEPYRGELSIRYRIDGVLYDANVGTQIKEFILPIISRIKIMCNLNIVEKRLPQDGRAVVKTQDQQLDLRVSTLPTPYGESMVIRILPTTMLFSMEKLGLNVEDRATLEELIAKPYGIIFITGPTGSGKTTSLYACLSQLNTRDRKIITIEDPIEYELKGITQIQVSSDIGFDFANGLRSILRHDPDIIMVGEVRDLETAQIAVRVALTGHLVFSTLHTNDAPTGITRLVDIGIEPYLISSIVQAFIAQRLVRVICPHCREEDKEAPIELKRRIAMDLKMKSIDEVKIFKGVGCDSCNSSGYGGRTGIYEIFVIDEVIKDLIIKRLTSSELKKIAIKRGMRSLEQDGWAKVISGITTPSEVMRVISNEGKELDEDQDGVDVFESSDVHTEKRRFTRLNTNVNIHYRIIKSKEELEKKEALWKEFSTTKNICGGGISFVSREELPNNSMLELTIEVPDGKDPIVCFAKVSWVKNQASKSGYEVGICFLDLTGAERVRIEHFVEEEV